MAVAAILDFWYLEILLAISVQSFEAHQHANFFKIGQSVAKILRFFHFSRWRPPPSWIFEMVNFYLLSVSGGPRRIIVPYFVKIGCSIVDAIFQIFKMADATILDFWNREILLAIWVQRVETHQRAKFCQNGSIGCKDIKIFTFFKMAAAAILDFWNREILLDIWVQTVESHQHAKFRQNRSTSSDDIKIFLFFKMAAVRHLGFVWGIFGPPTVRTWGSLPLCKIWLW